jgi:UDP-N-acetyl-D-glucosamine dehydrogenase
MMNVCIIGLGYVGLPLAIQFVESDVLVIGLDVDESKVDAINQGRSYIRHVPEETIEQAVSKKKLRA